MHLVIDDYVAGFSRIFAAQKDTLPWLVPQILPDILDEMITELEKSYTVTDGIAIHHSATVEKGVVLKAPVIVSENCFIGAHAYLRGGVFLGKGTTVGTGCEVKTSIIMQNSAVAHFNFVGDSIIGSNVNFEAGAVVANHFNERNDKQIRVVLNGDITDTNVIKFGALVGDNCKIGANAVLSPGTILAKDTIVKRLELVEQL
ncbi:LpxA family transferase [Pontibacter diazotrophicus]|uniref:LpxA family transferase n=1 Tax=Pontibacter diazotrophicus TaxID=1400979 RepID=A0A3D8LCB5_9BACT|nr:DapH/DapD/GlmU-related protein [Pontibacter diazotrophicus]RDV15057.1 LpxA family transferase [Pontibacter diazotrophicus]